MIRTKVLAAAERRLRATCDSLPPKVGEDRYREWAAELPAIIDDSEVRPALLRWICVWLFVLDQSRTVSRLHGSSLLDGSRRIFKIVSDLGRSLGDRRSLAFLGTMVLSGFAGGMGSGVVWAGVGAVTAALTVVMFALLAVGVEAKQSKE
ncbi:hypothetical protein E1293_42660 [Actinomadura darangshiensis]|uniref:Uncharacterized protein n=1 Tax=Actinomadura darangshiensis TaxID=705336 RepID=A0A4R4ZZT1_9ACTN|nr:hypothetical protein [Actinomadura darangshiensis]TDD63679.1 hypothetical protein E1293_42660 [Actinomadura darangshiensis]